MVGFRPTYSPQRNGKQSPRVETTGIDHLKRRRTQGAGILYLLYFTFLPSANRYPVECPRGPGGRRCQIRMKRKEEEVEGEERSSVISGTYPERHFLLSIPRGGKELLASFAWTTLGSSDRSFTLRDLLPHRPRAVSSSVPPREGGCRWDLSFYIKVWGIRKQ